MAKSKSNEPKPEVRFTVVGDEHGTLIKRLLEVLGYPVVWADAEGLAPDQLQWAIEQVIRRYPLTDRECDVFSAVIEGASQGASDKEIAKRLGISVKTVKWHLHNVFDKTKAGNRAGLQGLILQQLFFPRPPAEGETSG